MFTQASPYSFNSHDDAVQKLPDEIVSTSDFSVGDFPDDAHPTQPAPAFPKQVKTGTRVKKAAVTPIQLTERDMTLIVFCVRYGFCYAEALARLVGSTPASITKRLRLLTKRGLLNALTPVRGANLWVASGQGIALVGQTFPVQKTIKFATVQHTIALSNIAAELEREVDAASEQVLARNTGREITETKDVLGVQKWGETFPVRNRLQSLDEATGELSYRLGESTITEREIRQGQRRHLNMSTQELQNLVLDAVQNPAKDADNADDGGLFVLYSRQTGISGKTGWHVPDLVVRRPRAADGTPQNIAIEVELTLKSQTDLKRILRAYAEAGWMYSKVVYFTQDKEIHNAILKADETVRLGSRLVVRKYTPRNVGQMFLG